MEYILGIAASLFTQTIKAKFGTSEYVTLATVLGSSLFLAVVYTWLNAVGLMDSITTVLMTAGAFYAFIVQRVE